MAPASVKTTFSPIRAIQPFYTGGPVSIGRSGALLASSLDDAAVITSLASGRVLCELEGDSEPLTAIILTPDASHLVTLSRSLAMKIYKLKGVNEAVTDEDKNDAAIDAELLRTVKAHSSPVVVATVDKTGTLIATGAADGQVKVWDIRGGFVTHSFHGHSGLVSALHFFDAPAASSALAQKNIKKKKGENDTTGGLRLASGGEDGKIRIWNLKTSSSAATLDSHFSVVRGIDFSESENILISASRDKTVIAWDAKSWEIQCTIPVLESVECCGFVSHNHDGDDTIFYTAGENGRLRLWSLSRRGEVTEDQEPVSNDTESIITVLESQSTNELIYVRADQVLVFNSLMPLLNQGKIPSSIEPLPITRQVSGTHDEVIDMAIVGPQGTHLALATNTEDVRIISLCKDKHSAQPGRHDSYFGADTAHLSGHEDIVLALDIDPTGHWLATGSKDSTARLWRLDPVSKSYTCHSIYTGHAGSLGGISLPHTPLQSSSLQLTDPLSNPPKWLVTGSQDRTVKLWTVPAYTPGATEPAVGQAKYTRKAHDKDINALDTSFHSSNPLFASASQDKTVKIWDMESGETVGILRGHSRGVWTVRFSPVDQPLTVTGGSSGKGKGYVLTGAGDKTVKVWNLSDFSCVMTLEGHANSVLKVAWLPNIPIDIPTTTYGDNDDDMMMIDDLDEDANDGKVKNKSEPTSIKHRRTLVASAAADGLVKVWDLESAETACTLDAHVDRVWALAVSKPPAEDVTATSTSSEDGSKQAPPFTSITAAYPARLLISGGADAVINFWADTTSATASAARVQHSKMVEEEQRLANLQLSGRLREAVSLAIAMERPGTLLGIFKQLVEGDTKDVQTGVDSTVSDEATAMEIDDGDETVESRVKARRSRYKVPVVPSTGLVGSAISQLSDAQLYTLLIWIRDWNASAKSADVAQQVLYSLFRCIEVSRLVELEERIRRKPIGVLASLEGAAGAVGGDGGNGVVKGKLKKVQLRELVAGLRAYTERHQKRNEELEEESYLVDFLLGEMNDVLAG